MMRDRAVLQSIEHNRRITGEKDGEFLFLYQKAVLLALKEAGRLTEAQYRTAEERLREQRRAGTPGGEKT